MSLTVKSKKPLSFPCLDVQLVPTEKVVANDYNPNKVAREEMKLLVRSIEENGFLYPVTVIHDAEADLYVVVDGFHRHLILRDHFGCEQIPVVILEKGIQQRMAATVQTNRARGKHQVELMSQLVAKLLRLGWSDHEIAKELGMEAEEVLRLKQLTGIADLFASQEFSRAWVREPKEAQLYQDQPPPHQGGH